MNWLSMILFAGAAQGILLSVVILSITRSQRLANGFLSLFVGVSSLGLVMQFLALNELPAYAALSTVYFLVVLKGPALYFYVRALCEPEFRLQWGHLAHLLVCLPAAGVSLGAPLFGPSDDVLSSQGNTQGPWLVIAVMNLAAIVYGLFTFRVLARYRIALEEAFSSIEHISLSWLKWLIAFIILWRSVSIPVDLLWKGGILTEEFRMLAFACLHLVVIYIISIGGMRQSALFTQPFRQLLAEAHKRDSAPGEMADTTETDAPLDTATKYQRSGLAKDRAQDIWERLEHLMRQDKPHLDSALNLADLAQRLDIQSNDLSQVINTHSNGNFFDFVNAYRVEEAKLTLSQPASRDKKLFTIALEAGFNSQSTFYTHFKKHCGVTPKQFRDRQLATADAPVS